MREYKYDLHVHSCLSPCGDNDMTPNNIVNMALISGCEILAITDHNSCKNAGAVMRAARDTELLVIPGMELCVMEEAHIVCLFESLEMALEFDRLIYDKLPDIENRAEVFGEQLVCDHEDNVTGVEEKLLITAADISANDVVELVRSFGGAAFPAHLDRSSYSLMAALGAVPPEAGFKTAELTAACQRDSYMLSHSELREMLILTNSDSHYLDSLAGDKCCINLEDKSAAAIIRAVNSGQLGPQNAQKFRKK